MTIEAKRLKELAAWAVNLLNNPPLSSGAVSSGAPEWLSEYGYTPAPPAYQPSPPEVNHPQPLITMASAKTSFRGH